VYKINYLAKVQKNLVFLHLLHHCKISSLNRDNHRQGRPSGRSEAQETSRDKGDNKNGIADKKGINAMNADEF